MSGILAVLRGSGPSADVVEPMLDRLDHRGPDGSGLWIDGPVALGHQHLETTPQAAYDDQPLVDGDLAVVAHARLDNRSELFDALEVDGDPAHVPDSEVLLAAYREWGDDCVEQLVGAFAFALWDAERGRLLCARDHFGTRPLYCYRSEDCFAVASEEKALLALPGVSTRVDEVRVGDFLAGQFEAKRPTYFQSIERLPPAHACSVPVCSSSSSFSSPSASSSSRGSSSSGRSSDTAGSTREHREWQYWTLDPTRTVELSSEEAYVRRFRELFEQSVQARLRTDDAVGTTLSGGLDSSSVTTVARELLPRDRTLQTFSGVFEETDRADEREYVEAVVDRPGIEPHYVNVDGLSPIAHFDRALAHYDQPVRNTMDYMNWALAGREADADVGVVLEGTHGDSAVDYGLGLLPELARRGRWLHLWRELRAMGDRVDRSPTSLLRSRVLQHLVPEPVSRATQRLRGRPSDLEQANPALDPEFVARIGLDARYRELEPGGPVRRRSARRWQRRSLLTGQMTAYFEANDRTHAAHGVEPRYPFVDPRFVEFSLAMPPSLKLSDGWTRYVLRRALDDYLPEPVQWRPWKTMLNLGFQRGLRAETDRICARVVGDEALEPYLDAGALEAACERAGDDPAPSDGRVLWRAYSLSRWLESSPASR